MATTDSWTATASGSWRTTYGWRTDNNYAYQGQWEGFGLHKGLWFFDHANMRTVLAGRRILSVKFTITRVASGGSSAASYPYFRMHNYGSQPSGEPDLISGYGSPVAFAWGDRKTVTMREVWGEYLRDGQARGFAVYTTSDSPYMLFEGATAVITITHEATNRAPYAPVQLAPSTGANLEVDTDHRFRWNFSDPDSGDYQTQLHIVFRDVATGDQAFYRYLTTQSEFYDLRAGTLEAGDYEWRVRTRDPQDVYGPYSSWRAVTMIAAPNSPTITDPVSDQVLTTDSYQVRWAPQSGQEAAEVRRVADDGAGSADASTVYESSGTLGANVRAWVLSLPVNNQTEHFQVRVQESGLWSEWRSVRVQVDYRQPPMPTVTQLTPLDAIASIDVDWSVPAPAGDMKAPSRVEVRRRTLDEEGDGIRVAEAIFSTEESDTGPWSGTLRDPTPGSGVPYEYQVVAVADTGTRTASDWEF